LSVSTQSLPPLPALAGNTTPEAKATKKLSAWGQQRQLQKQQKQNKPSTSTHQKGKGGFRSFILRVIGVMLLMGVAYGGYTIYRIKMKREDKRGLIF